MLNGVWKITVPRAVDGDCRRRREAAYRRPKACPDYCIRKGLPSRIAICMPKHIRGKGDGGVAEDKRFGRGEISSEAMSDFIIITTMVIIINLLESFIF